MRNPQTMSSTDIIIKYKTHSLDQWKWLSEQYSKIPIDAKIIELGGGYGLFWQYKAPSLSKGNTILFTDISQDRINKAKKDIEQAKTPATFVFEKRDVYSDITKKEINSYDIVMAHSLIYLLKEPMTFLKKTKSLLKPEGFLGVSVLTQNSLSALFLLGCKVDSKAPKTSFTDQYCDTHIEPDLKEVFGSHVEKREYKCSLLFTKKSIDSKIAVGLYKKYPNVNKQNFSPAFFTKMEKEIDNIIEEKGGFEINYGINLYFAKKENTTQSDDTQSTTTLKSP